MLKSYHVKTAPKVVELKQGPSELTLNAILNYSRSVVSKKVNNKQVLFNLN